MRCPYDFVPAVAANWSHPPFAADLVDGFVWGRGAIDNKAHGIMALMTLLTLKRNHTVLNRGVVMMVNPDEESGGGQGAEWMAANHWDTFDPAFASPGATFFERLSSTRQRSGASEASGASSARKP